MKCTVNEGEKPPLKSSQLLKCTISFKVFKDKIDISQGLGITYQIKAFPQTRAMHAFHRTQQHLTVYKIEGNQLRL